MPSVHFFRWVDNLPIGFLDMYWLNITGSKYDVYHDKFKKTYLYTAKRKVAHIKGEYVLSKKFPFFYQKLRPLFEVTENVFLQTIIEELKPDIIHSFEMQSCSYPILKTMNKYSDIKWIYSSWGSDLHYYRQFSSHRKMIAKVLQRVNYLITDCKRDYGLANALNFNGIYLGAFPGGGGYDINEFIKYSLPFKKRTVILVKGYQHNFGRALKVVKAMELISSQLKLYKVVVFGAHISVIDYIEEKKIGFETFHRHQLKHEEVIKLMGESLIYIGNSTSDGIPNTLLEAVSMGAFPIQSNPGKASEEIIENEKNGLLINNPEDITEIKNIILASLKSSNRLKKAFDYNLELAKRNLNKEIIKQKIHDAYASVLGNKS